MPASFLNADGREQAAECPPLSNFVGNERTTGTINPGLLYLADKYQLGVEASFP